MAISSLKEELNRQRRNNALLCVASILVNVVGSFVSSKLGCPLYLDSIGTIFASALGGFLPGIVTGFLTNVLKGFWDLSSIYYIPINIMLALVMAFFARRGKWARFPQILLLLICLAFVGGGIGSVLTWYLYNSSFTAGAFGESLLARGVSPFIAQIASDFSLDLADKAISLLVLLIALRLLPASVKDAFSADRISAVRQDTIRRYSLRTKVLLLFAGLMLIVAIAVTGITISLFHDSVIEENAGLAYSAARIAAGTFDPDRVQEYIELGDEAEGYAEIDAALARIAQSSDDINYVYVYQIREDGCHVVFDPDTDEGPGSDPGEIMGFDEAFMDVLPTLLEGGEIDPIISNETFGWLLSVYVPVFDSQGVCQCYVGVDISMPRLRATEHVFQTQMISLFLGFTLFVTALGIQLAENSLIRPINSISSATTAFAKRSVDAQDEGLAAITSLNIRTGDEIENLYHAIFSTAKEVVQSINDIQHKNEQITRLQSGLIMVLADMVESRDKCTGNHVRNTASYVSLILNRMREKGMYPDVLTEEYITDVVSSAPLHDVGKIKVPDALLNKPGKLTEEEFSLMKQHTIAGGEIIDSAISLVADDSSLYLNEAKKLTLYHHERWDGKGYPYGIKGEEIPLSARVMAVADVFDALVSRRSYKEGFPVDKALSIIMEESGTHFDPEVVEAFMECQDQARAIAEAANIKSAKEY